MKAKKLSVEQYFVFTFKNKTAGVFKVVSKEKDLKKVIAKEITLDYDAGDYPRISIFVKEFFFNDDVTPLRGVQSCLT